MPSDIRRISRATGLKPEKFVRAVDEPPGRERTEPAVIIEGKRSLLILRWSALRHCIFYAGNAGCGIYRSRPLLCRTYPFRLEKGKLANMKSRACPVLWIPGPKEQKKYAQDIKRYGAALAKYRKVAEEWNAHGGGTLREFLRACAED
jgi:Fe-S-cluster containining protein